MRGRPYILLYYTMIPAVSMDPGRTVFTALRLYSNITENPTQVFSFAYSYYTVGLLIIARYALTLLGTALGHLDPSHFKVKYLHDDLRQKKFEIVYSWQNIFRIFFNSKLLSIKHHFQC